MTGQSWGIYVFHYLPLACVAYYLRKFAPELPAVVVYLILLGDESQGIAVIKEDRLLDMLKRREITGEIGNA
jgi:hypothetical protein